ncbi:UNVERIFIED_CONTAM: hypothetical protein K2H54_051876 [Gekko kuhli]
MLLLLSLRLYLQVSPYDNNPCTPCECDLFGSLEFDCVKDDDHAELQHGVHPGQCRCKEGYAGEKCDHCAFGFKGYPNCVHCNCSLVGSINDDPCTEPCLCKENVEGENCDRCKPGFYNLQERNPQGCTECFCFGVSDVCESLPWPINQLTAFGGYLKYTVSYDIPMESTDSDLVSNVDVIIQGNGHILCTRSEGLSLQPYEEYSNTVRLVSENFIDFNTKKLVDRDILMTVLANVTRLLLRANYNVAKKAVYRLSAVTLDTANANLIDLTSAVDVEYCECPQGYFGISCEGCKHNTTGHSCDQCLPGFYGVSSRGTPEDCQPCACPLKIATNNFSPTCHLDNEGEVICDKCPAGYAGTKCERCANGYFGNPLMPGQSCLPCDCNGNVDSMEDGYCNSLTGECLKCTGNTAGHHCEKCADGFFGDAVTNKDCHVNLAQLLRTVVMKDSVAVCQEWLGRSVVTALMGFMHFRMVDAHLVTVRILRTIVIETLGNAFAHLILKEKNVNSVRKISGVLIQKKDVSVRMAMEETTVLCVPWDTEAIQIVFLVTVTCVEPQQRHVIKVRESAVVKRTQEFVPARAKLDYLTNFLVVFLVSMLRLQAPPEAMTDFLST